MEYSKFHICVYAFSPVAILAIFSHLKVEMDAAGRDRKAGTTTVLAHTSGAPKRQQVWGRLPPQRNITLKTGTQCKQQNA